MIKNKLQHIGEAGVKAVGMAEDLENTKKSLVDGEKFLIELDHLSIHWYSCRIPFSLHGDHCSLLFYR